MNLSARQLGDLTPTNPNRRQGLLAVFHIDLPLLVGLLLLCGFGLIVLYSASGENMAQTQRQAVRIGVAFVVMLTVAQINPITLRRWSPWLFLGGILLLGVADDGTVLGLEPDGFENEDKCRLHFKNLLNQHIGLEYSKYLQFHVQAVESLGVVPDKMSIGNAQMAQHAPLTNCFEVTVQCPRPEEKHGGQRDPAHDRAA